MTNRTASSAPALKHFLRAARPLAGVALATSLLLAPRVASAQAWLKDRKIAEGSGIRVGDVELHPGIGGEIGYDSNWFLRTYKQSPDVAHQFVNGAPLNPPVEGGTIRITPSFTVNTIQGERGAEGGAGSAFAFNAGVAATYREFLGPAELRDQRNISGNAFARADINQNRPIGFGIFANYQRLIQPAVVADPNLSFNRSDVGVGAEVIAIPGGGTLDIRAGYQLQAALFEESNGVPYSSITHEISVRNRWRFRPRTALFHDTTLRFINYPNANRALNLLEDSTPVRTRFGVTGLLTDRFGVLLAAGYGASFYKSAPPAAGGLDATSQYDNFNAQAEGTFYLSQGGGSNEPGQATLLLSTITFGYARDFQNSLLGNYYSSNKGYLRVVYLFGGNVVLQLDSYVEGLGYPQPFYNSPTGPRAVNGLDGKPTGDFTNIHFGGTFFGEYRFTKAFGINTTIDYAQTISDVALEAGNGPPVTGPGGVMTPGAIQYYDLSWRRIQAFIGARYFF